MALTVSNMNDENGKFQESCNFEAKKKRSFWNLFRSKSKKQKNSKLDLSKADDIKKKLGQPIDLNQVRVRSRTNFERERPSSCVMTSLDHLPSGNANQHLQSTFANNSMKTKRTAPDPPYLKKAVGMRSYNSENQMATFSYEDSRRVSMIPAVPYRKSSRPLPSLSSILPPPPNVPPPNHVPVLPHPYKVDKSTNYNAESESTVNNRKGLINNLHNKSENPKNNVTSKESKTLLVIRPNKTHDESDTDSSDANTPTTRRKFSIFSQKSRSCKDLTQIKDYEIEFKTEVKSGRRVSTHALPSGLTNLASTKQVPSDEDYSVPTRRTQTLSNAEFNSVENKRFSTPQNFNKDVVQNLELEKRKRDLVKWKIHNENENTKSNQQPKSSRTQNFNANGSNTMNTGVSQSRFEREPSLLSTTSSVVSSVPPKIITPKPPVKPKPNYH